MHHPKGFPSRLVRLRAEAGMTQQELAKASGISKPQIGRYETGVSKKPRMTAIVKLARALNVDVSELLSAEDEPETVELDGYWSDGEHFQPFAIPKEMFERVQKEAEELGTTYEVWIATAVECKMIQNQGGEPDFDQVLEKNKKIYAGMPMPNDSDRTQ